MTAKTNADLVVDVLIGLGSGSLGSIITALITGGFQHLNWRRQRRAELRLALVDEIKKVTWDFFFIVQHTGGNPLNLPDDFWPRWVSASSQLRFLFNSTEALAAFGELYSCISEWGPGRSPKYGPNDIYPLIAALLQALYKEIQLVKPSIRSRVVTFFVGLIKSFENIILA